MDSLPIKAYKGGVSVGSTTDGTASTVYTVPADHSFIIANLHVANESTSATKLQVIVANAEFLSNVTVPANGVLTFTSKIVLYEGDVIGANASVSGVTLHVDGFLVATS